jgi:hypothetical protein
LEVVAVLVIGDGRAQVIHACEGGLPGSGDSFGEFSCRNHPGLERGVIGASEADKFDGREARCLHGRVQVPERSQHRRCEVLRDRDVMETAITQLRLQTFPPVHSIVCRGAPVLGEHLLERRPVRQRSRRAVRAGEVSLSNPSLEVLQRHAPQVRPIVQKLGQALPEIRVLGASLELDKCQIATVA